MTVLDLREALSVPAEVEISACSKPPPSPFKKGLGRRGISDQAEVARKTCSSA